MMFTLERWYPGDSALEFVLVVAAGVAVLSLVAWIVARRLPKRPAARHLVLISALMGCLTIPVLAAVSSALGLTLISIPILSRQPDDTAARAGTAEHIAAPRVTFTGDRMLTTINRPRTPADPPRSGDRSVPSVSHDATPAVATSASLPTPQPFERRSDLHPAGGPLPYRAIAALALLSWGWGSVLLLLRLARSWQRVHRLVRSSVPLADETLRRLWNERGSDMGIQRRPRLLVSRRAPAPLAFGLCRPVIILPDSLFGAVSDDEMGDVLLHELAHVRRGDPLAVIVGELARALYWPIVPIHALIHELARAREELCDNHVLHERDPVSYGETLLHLAELSHKARPLFAAVGVMQWPGELEQRIAGLLEEGRSTMTRNNRSLICLVTLAVIAAGTVASATRLSAFGRQAQRPSRQIAVTTDAKTTKAPSDPAMKNAARTMLVHVLGPDGRPMSGVSVLRSVWTKQPNKGHDNYVSDGRGPLRVEVPEGTYILRLWAVAKGHVPLFAHWEEKDIAEQPLPAEFTFKIRPGTTIGGVVRDGEGRPIKGAKVEVMLDRGGESEPRISTNMWLALGDDAPVTNEKGQWTLDNIPPGDDLELRLKLSHPDFISDAKWGTMQDQQGVDLKALRARMATIAMRGGIVATGTVRDAQGKPIAGAVVVRGDRPYWEQGSQEVRTDERGRYRLPPLPTSTVTVTAIAPAWMPALTKADIHQGMGPVDFRLQPGKDLRVRVVDQSGKPVAGADVRIEKWRGGQSLYNDRHPTVLDTQVPFQSDDSGRYYWSWAPDDAVTFQFYKDGHVRHEATLVASASEHTVTLPKVLRIAGSVTDREGGPIKGVTAIPVLEFASGNLLVERNRAKGPFHGNYAVEVDRTDVAYRVRVEAPGYRSTMTDVARAGALDPKFDVRLEPAPPVEGRVLDRDGRPIKDARVYLATASQNLNNWREDNSFGSVNQQVVTDSQGRFSFPAQFERYAVVVVHDGGYAEVHREVDQTSGDLTLRAWAEVEGRLIDAGRPIAGAWVFCGPVRILNETLPHIQDTFAVKTDRDGRFVCRQVPPVKSRVNAQLSVWRDFPYRSSQSIPIDLQPGQKVRIDLGGTGTMVTGRVVLSGDAIAQIDLHKSLNWLLRRTPGIEPPPEFVSSGLSAQAGWNNAWRSTREGRAFIETLHTYFVVLDREGRFQINGVPAGDYDLALRLYEPPGDGCLVSPVGSRIVRFQVTDAAARGPRFDLGEIPVKVAIGPRVGDLAPEFTAELLGGGRVSLRSLQGRYVLLDFWATWCGPCVANFPELSRFHDTFAADKHVTILSLNLDNDPADANAFLAAHKLPWTHGYLGGQASDKADALALYGVSFIPTYILIGPDGKLIYRGDKLEEIAEMLKRGPR